MFKILYSYLYPAHLTLLYLIRIFSEGTSSHMFLSTWPSIWNTKNFDLQKLDSKSSIFSIFFIT